MSIDSVSVKMYPLSINTCKNATTFCKA